MKTKKKDDFPFMLIGSALVFLGLAAYVYLSTKIDEEEIDFDLWDEDISDYA
ncbi:hypothetical protein H9Q13_02085 [Pontibacter sp. JH31]|uniref:Energy transducer TonB n=1 Tax=Pontibacter aquaedesilientis TaxID=2766980 RepID=A0ABR7XDF2_9BACT|nr:hypothetical protein [Pontibacter aquaedesilientis]MBD1395941.1 hypothetical protein [Pontibacter aquaedesilientis]